ncbi:MAG: DUF4339 domain-containing protein [Bacteriovoracaceae bacterium]|nr:DUF4339 domain-containing protein [Bacteriovoracaceae bacterium]
MAKWYYVQDGERQGPVDEKKMQALAQAGTLTNESYVWKKGMKDWAHLADVAELTALVNNTAASVMTSSAEEEEDPAFASLDSGDNTASMMLEEMPRASFDWHKVDTQQKVFMIKTGIDRGANEAEYGPFNLAMLQRLLQEKRINLKTLVYTPGMDTWEFLADTPLAGQITSEVPPVIAESERRKAVRRPFIAKMFLSDDQQVFEGVCRDISIGGLQILAANVPVKVGDTISMNVHPDNTQHSFVATGRVVRLLGQHQGLSVRFQNLDDAARQAINAYLDQAA